MNINNCFIVVKTNGGGESPVYNGAFVAGVYDTLDEAKERLAGVAKEMCDSLDAEVQQKWYSGYCDDDRPKWADNYWSDENLTAWINGLSDNWEKVEIFSKDKYGNWKSLGL